MLMLSLANPKLAKIKNTPVRKTRAVFRGAVRHALVAFIESGVSFLDLEDGAEGNRPHLLPKPWGKLL
jgi:hypothetical protein